MNSGSGEFADQWLRVAEIDEKVAASVGDLESCRDSRMPWPDRHTAGVDTTRVPPIEALFMFFSRGRYPPPALLLYLEEQFEAYLNAGGKKSLDDVFLGKPKKKAGNYARQRAKQLRDIGIALQFDERQYDGLSMEAIAGKIADSGGLGLGDRSILRIAQNAFGKND